MEWVDKLLTMDCISLVIILCLIVMYCVSVVVEKQFSCPMCALVCTDAFIPQEHVELHLLEESPAEGTVSTVQNI